MSEKLYLAGPEVFLPDAAAVMARKADLARRYGFEPICPGDSEVPAAASPHAFGLAISRIDEEMMESADGIVANLTPFRGLAADTGTSFELGFMCARGKKAAAYTNVAEDHAARVHAHYAGQVSADAAGLPRGPDGLLVETFGMIDNLMLHGGVERRGGPVIVHRAAPEALYSDLTGFEVCLKALAEAG